MNDGSEAELTIVERVAKAMEEKRAELINQPLARIWSDLAMVAVTESIRHPEISTGRAVGNEFPNREPA